MRLDHMTDDERISIHAPRKGERPASAYCVMCPPYFNPRSPQGGATFPPSFFTSAVAVFQSTLPARGSDFGAGGCLHGRPLFQSTLPARGSDVLRCWHSAASPYFNPRSPQGGATEDIPSLFAVTVISIHAPRKGERPDTPPALPRRPFISIHAPRKGERPHDSRNPRSNALCRAFQSTLPARGSDIKNHAAERGESIFQSTLPARGSDRTLFTDFMPLQDISIHAPRKGERRRVAAHTGESPLFQSTLPARGSDSGKVHLYAAFPRIC